MIVVDPHEGLGLGVKPGNRLPNGAIVVAERPTEDGHGYVLAFFPDMLTQSSEYIRWAYTLRPEPTGEVIVTYWGHYFPNVLEAAHHFEFRGKAD